MSFDKAFEIVLGAEGGYSNDRLDPGGETNYGIADARDGKKDGLADLDGDGRGDVSIRDLTVANARSVYRMDYWDACGCDALPWPLSLYVFDAAVNQGVGAAKRMLQRALGTVQDEVIGATTLALAEKSGPWHRARFMAFRAQRYMATRNFDRFGNGWLTRLFDVFERGGE